MDFSQWTFRNGTVHLKGPDGLSPTQQNSLARRCEDLLWTYPSSLLDEDKYLLDIDFEDLGDGAADSRQMWISEMEAALAAARDAGREGIDKVAGDSFPFPPCTCGHQNQYKLLLLASPSIGHD